MASVSAVLPLPAGGWSASRQAVWAAGGRGRQQRRRRLQSSAAAGPGGLQACPTCFGTRVDVKMGVVQQPLAQLGVPGASGEVQGVAAAGVVQTGQFSIPESRSSLLELAHAPLLRRRKQGRLLCVLWRHSAACTVAGQRVDDPNCAAMHAGRRLSVRRRCRLLPPRWAAPAQVCRLGSMTPCSQTQEAELVLLGSKRHSLPTWAPRKRVVPFAASSCAARNQCWSGNSTAASSRTHITRCCSMWTLRCIAAGQPAGQPACSTTLPLPRRCAGGRRRQRGSTDRGSGRHPHVLARASAVCTPPPRPCLRAT